MQQIELTVGGPIQSEQRRRHRRFDSIRTSTAVVVDTNLAAAVLVEEDPVDVDPGGDDPTQRQSQWRLLEKAEHGDGGDDPLQRRAQAVATTI
jgi:hypothetical protein